VLSARTRPNLTPLSAGQERLFTLERLGTTGTAYNYPLAFRLHGAFDTPAFVAALHDVVDRHEVLRTVFDDQDGTSFQQIRPTGTAVPVTIADCDDSDVAGLVDEAVGYQFDLTADIPLRAHVLRLSDVDNVVVLILHHVAVDAWSDAPLLDDLDLAYQARQLGHAPSWSALPVQYADYALWQHELLSEVADEQTEFWTAVLADAPDELELPADRPRPAQPSGLGGSLDVELADSLVSGLRLLAAEHQVSTLMCFHAAVATLLQRVGAGDDIIVGTAVAGRTEADLNLLVGFFVNTVVLRVGLSDDPTFVELLKRVRDADLAAFDHQDLPFERVVEAVNPPRAAGRNPLFQTFVGYQYQGAGSEDVLGMATEWLAPTATAAKFDLGFTLIDDVAANRMTVMSEFATDCFNPSTVAHLAERLVVILGQMVANPAVRIADVDVLLPGERQWLATVGTGDSETVASVDLGTLIAGQAQRTPQVIAVRDQERALTYAQLDDWSSRLASELIRHGAAASTVVGVSLPRSIELVVALVAVVRSGAAFLPLDSEYPPDRLSYMIADAKPVAVISDPEYVRNAESRPHLGVDETEAVDPSLGSTLDPARWAYVLYTSGTTGRPKGVVVSHQAIVNRIAWAQHAFPLNADDRMLMKTPISFDVSVPEVFWPLTVGATLVIARPGGHREPRYLVDLIESERVTALHFVPSMLELFFDEALDGRESVDRLSSLTRVTVSGEALPQELADRVTGHLGVPLHNLYGPTEAAVDVLGWTADGGPVAIGGPCWNVQVYVLDQRLQMTPPGVPGELYLSGVQLADGYLGKGALTGGRFVADPFAAAGARMYRTGDLVRWRADGQLEYRGRTDDQIKLRGVRIEPGEIETVLATHPSVSSVRVVVRNDRLVAYYVPADQIAPLAPPPSLREHATSALPIHMVPSAFVELASFPLTPSGKLDRKALPDPPMDSEAGRPPVTAQQRRLCELFSHVLDVDVTSIDDDFFSLGGHSLLLVRLAAAIRREFDSDIPVADLMVAPTVADITARLTSNGVDRAVDSLAPVLPLRSSGTQPPLFCLHPASGLSWQFAGLKKYLPQDIPLYGLQSPIFSGDELPATMVELAAGYTDTIEAVTPTGDVRLLDWSFGGSMALLIAQELTRRGRDVGFVGMLDSRNDAVGDRFQTTAFDPTAVLAGLLREMGFAVDPDARMTVSEAVELVRASGDAIAILDDDQISLVIENYVAAEQLTATADYGHYERDVFFVDATVLEMDLVGVASEGWRDHVGGELRVVELTCRHSELMDLDTLERLGPLIATELNR